MIIRNLRRRPEQRASIGRSGFTTWPKSRTPVPIIDGVVYGFQRHGGINALFNEIVPRMAHRFGPVVMMLPFHPVGETPRGWRVRRLPGELVPHSLALGPARKIWSVGAACVSRVVRDVVLSLKSGAVFQSTYFTTTNACPSVAMVYDMNHELYANQYAHPAGIQLRNAYAQSVRGAARVIAISAKTRDDAIRIYGIPSDRVDVIHLAASQKNFFPDRSICPAVSRVLQALDGLPYVLYLGVRNWYKGFSTFLAGLARANRAGEVAGVVAGAPLTLEERRTIQELGLAHHVHVCPHPSIPVLRRLYSRSRAFVFPSISEGFGVPILEAFACGTTVIASDTEVFREVAGDAALFFPPGDPGALAAAIVRAGKTNRDEMAAVGQRRMLDFSWDRTAERFWTSYCRALTA